MRRLVGVFGIMAMTVVLVVAAATRADAAVVVTVDPSTGLADGQPVTITGTGFAPGASVGAAECGPAVGQSRSTNDCDLSNAPIVQADSNGTAVLHLRARATITTTNSGAIDCVTTTQPCVIGMGDTSDLTNPDKTGGAPITFDPNAPPVPPPAVSLTPSDDLVDRQQVAVYATGFLPGEFVNIVQCAAQNLDKTPCNESFYFGGGGQADPTGAVAFGLTVRRALRVDNQRFDCASAVGACVVAVQAQGGPVGTAPLGFDASVPLPPPPTLTVTPTDGLGDGDIVHVHGEGFTPNDPIQLFQCPSDVNILVNGCFSEYSRSVQADASGAITASMKVERQVQVFGPTPQPTTVDCAASAGRCDVIAFDYNEDFDTVSVPISFDPSKPPAPPPSASASPSTALVDGQTVTVSADGFPPGGNLFMVECKAGSTDGSGCDLSRLTNVTVDDNGRFETQFAVQRILNLGPPVIPPPTPKTAVPQAGPAAAAFLTPAADSSTFDCASAPGACVISFAFLGPEIEFAEAPLTFDASVPPPTTAAPGGIPNQPTDAGGGGTDTSTSTTATQATTAPTVQSAPLARTGTDVRSPLRVDLLLLVAGALALVSAAALRARAHRRATRTRL
ncbi:MAG TPA: neocarzinostatin apoprotein domain-containing protein [Acidimicrobiales bacterium]|nr:neocarzinostatin apoprotein domain-containing protein [Acidimicrobiales bacterium]